jgi:VanZ family protein
MITALTSGNGYLPRLIGLGLRIGPWACILLIAILSLVPGEERPHTGMPGQAEHFLAYFITGALLAGRLGWTSRRRWAAAAGLSAYGGVLEILQIWVPGRCSQFIDFAASSAGAICGTIAAGVALSVLAKMKAAPAGHAAT